MARRGLPYFYEAVLESPRVYQDPVRDVAVRVVLRAPSGRRLAVPAFWDGGRIWRFRCDPDEPGRWAFAAEVAEGGDFGPAADWLGARGEFTVRPYAGPNPLYRHGPLRVSARGTHLEHADGTPFFWLADTAWNGLLRAEPADWEHYLARRVEQGFTAIQCVLTNWRAFPADARGERAYEGEQAIRPNPRFLRPLDAKVAAIAAHGLVPALVLLWALTPRDPGHHLPEEDAILLARYLVARYGAFRPVWFLGGDGRYEGERAERWRRIGRAVFPAGAPRSLVTLHPCGYSWVGDLFRDEPWFDFIGYQSSHSGEPRAFDFIALGPPATHWDRQPRRPVLNLEPCYEAHRAVGTDRFFTAQDVRIALYLSLLVSPTAGVTYGHAGIWPWSELEESPLDHLGAGIAPPWRQALESEGAASVTCLRHFFQGLPWWTLRPAPHLVLERPAHPSGREFVAAALAEDGRLAVVFLPQGGAIRLAPEMVARLPARQWFDPRTAARQPAEVAPAGQVVAPDQRDWLLVLAETGYGPSLGLA